jgi:hypothetical protein
MKASFRLKVTILLFCLIIASLVSAEQPRAGLLNSDELKQVVPPSYFFRGQSAPVQLRNSAGFRAQDGKLVLAGFVDTSGYAADVAEKYQGFLITEIKLNIEGSELAPGQYGFGFSKDGKFLVMDVAANDLFRVVSQSDEKLTHPVPLKIVQDGGTYKLYAGRKWVSLKGE